jgi:electron-transferring-flavoprotein dehydrogenase
MYVHPDHVASVGIFIPSSFDNPVRTSYRYLQHWMMHPYIWRYLKGGTLKSWGAKTLQESGKRGEPFLVGDGYARIGEGSASTNMLTSSGVDEAWMTGVLLAEAVNELAEEKKPFTRENLERTYLYKRRESWLEKELKQAERARDGFQKGFFTGLFGMALTGFTKGKLNLSAKIKATFERIPSLQAYYKDKLSDSDIQRIRKQSLEKNVAMSDAILTHVGWPEISYDGQLLMSHQDALLMGGKVQAPPGYKDHVIFIYPHLCETCESKICVELCSGQAITPGENGVPVFEREKCVHCGACLWNCTVLADKDKKKTNIDFTAGPGGLHSAEN